MPSSLTARIDAIQNLIGVPETGIFDRATCEELLKRGEKIFSSTDLKTLIKMVQRMVNATDDGVAGPQTVTRVEAFVTPVLPKRPPGSTLSVSARSVEALIGFEVTSKAFYEIRYQSPVWPGGDSGITIGIGYDLGFNTKKQIEDAWGPHISPTDLALLKSVSKFTGQVAKNALPGVKSVTIPFTTAITVFSTITLPIYAGMTRSRYPGVEKLPPDAQGALLSLIYNRGTGIEGDTRREMKNIIPLVAAGDLAGIAAEIRSMKRIWKNKNLPGLIERREKEAQMVENSSLNILPEDIVHI